MPTVSVIIPTYNRANFLMRAVKSVYQQTFKDFEVIIVDDGSTDETQQCLPTLGFQFCYKYLPHSGIPAYVRNEGIKEARGDYVAFLDDDDTWLPDKLERQMELAEKYPYVVLFSSNAYSQSYHSNQAGELYLQIHDQKLGNLFWDLINDNFVITSTVLVERAILNHLGGFNQDQRLIGIEDYEMWLRVARDSDILFDPKPLAIYTTQGHRLSSRNASKYWSGMLFLMEENNERIGVANKLSNNEKAVIYTRIARCKRKVLQSYVYDRNFSEALKFIRNNPSLILEILVWAMKKILQKSIDPQRKSL